MVNQAPDQPGLARKDESATIANSRVASSEDDFSGWDEFQCQASGNEYEMVDEAIATARLSEHILSPEPKKRVMIVL